MGILPRPAFLVPSTPPLGPELCVLPPPSIPTPPPQSVYEDECLGGVCQTFGACSFFTGHNLLKRLSWHSLDLVSCLYTAFPTFWIFLFSLFKKKS